jgi:hypothetical protein
MLTGLGLGTGFRDLWQKITVVFRILLLRHLSDTRRRRTKPIYNYDLSLSRWLFCLSSLGHCWRCFGRLLRSCRPRSCGLCLCRRHVHWSDRRTYHGRIYHPIISWMALDCIYYSYYGCLLRYYWVFPSPRDLTRQDSSITGKEDSISIKELGNP